MKKIFMLFATVFIVGSNLMAKPDYNSQVKALLKKMTLEEKIGQMNQYTGFWDVTGPVPEKGNSKKKYEQLASGQIGSMLNVSGVEEARKLQEVALKSRLKIPLIFGFDVIHGHKTLSPIPLAEAASWDMKAIEQSARFAAIEASAKGIHWTFGPMVDICRDARWGRVMEGAGEDPYLGSKVAAARVKGFQGEDLSAPDTIAACAKHYAAYGFTEAGRDYNTVDISMVTLYNVVLLPFKSAVDSGVCTLMNSFNTLNGVPATGSSFLQRDILKGKWGFNGFVVSDWGSIGEMVKHGVAADLKAAAAKAAIAGSDMDMESNAYINHLKALVESGAVKESVIDEAAGRVLKIKFELGLFDDPFRYCDAEREKKMVYSKEQRAAVLDMARKSIVLLKNEGGLLPLDKNQKKIAVIGALADDNNSPLGSWRINSDDNSAVTVLDGLKKYTKEFTYKKGADLYTGDAEFRRHVNINKDDKSGFSDAVKLAKDSEVVIMVLGEHGFQTGEGRSRANIDLPGVQQELLEAVYAVNKNIILVVMSGRPLALTWADKNVPAILEAWQLGTETGNAIAQVLFNEYNPSAKLPISFPRSVGQCPIYYNHLSTGRPDSSDMVFWSHYTDESNDPLYPFGHGLSYTSFEYADLKVDATNPAAVKVSATVKNTGKLDGEEIVQLYIRDRVASISRPVKELKGFEKITLESGKTKTVSFTLTAKELGFYNAKGEYSVEPGMFDVMVGSSSVKGLKSEFELK